MRPTLSRLVLSVSAVYALYMLYATTLVKMNTKRRTDLDFVAPEVKRQIDLADEVCSADPAESHHTLYQNYSSVLTVRSFRADSPDEGYDFLAHNNKLVNHLIVDDRHKVLYCYVPKVACTNWKRLMMILSGTTNATDPNKLNADSVHRDGALSKLHENSPEEILLKLQTYKKFMFTRDPLERCLSAFRNKFEKNYKSSLYFKRRYGVRIQKMFRTGNDAQTISTRGDGTTFAEFAEYLIHSGRYEPSHFNEHWTPMVELCQPCLVRYDYIGKYETLEEDSKNILSSIGAPVGLKLPFKKKSVTKSLLPDYLSELTPKQQIGLQKLYAEDIALFGYTFRGIQRKKRKK